MMKNWMFPNIETEEVIIQSPESALCILVIAFLKSSLLNGVSDSLGVTTSGEIIEEQSSRKYAMFEYSYDSSEEKESEELKTSARDYVYASPAGLYLPPDLILVCCCSALFFHLTRNEDKKNRKSWTGLKYNIFVYYSRRQWKVMQWLRKRPSL